MDRPGVVDLDSSLVIAVYPLLHDPEKPTEAENLLVSSEGESVFLAHVVSDHKSCLTEVAASQIGPY